MKTRRNWGSVFRDAWNGIWSSLKSERNLRIHVLAAVIVLLAAAFFRLPVRDVALLLLVIALVITAELINTAIEAAVDLAAPEWHRLAKIAKDAAAGAVLAAAAFAVVIGIMLFYGPVMAWLGWGP
ncbi:diacylglycerol kinase family protein [Paenibacillus sp. M1]|uniref:Diacylglycerol kinase family protein n=1 Tax=Paenibacillus haidiansis TaxID=1574488 RepID=A0ABU7VLS9_9BACL